MIDAEIKGTLDDSYKRAMNILVTHKNELHMLAGGSSQYCEGCFILELFCLCRSASEVRDPGRG